MACCTQRCWSLFDLVFVLVLVCCCVLSARTQRLRSKPNLRPMKQYTSWQQAQSQGPRIFDLISDPKNPNHYVWARNRYDVGSNKCKSEFYGHKWFERLQNEQVDVCRAQSSQIGFTRSKISAIKCTFMNYDAAESYCGAYNFAINLAKLQNFFATSPKLGDVDENQRIPFASVGCRFNESAWQAASFGKGSQQWMYNYTTSHNSSDFPSCIATIDHPVFFIQDLYDPCNMYHGLEALIHAFEAYAAFGIDPALAQIITVDNFDQPENYFKNFWPAWKSMFSPNREVTSLKTLLKQAVEQTIPQAHNIVERTLHPNAALCFRFAAFDTHGGVSPFIRSIGGPTHCRGSAVINGFSDMMLDALGLWKNVPGAPSQKLEGGGDVQKFTLVWASRAGYSRDIQNEVEVLHAIITRYGHVIDVKNVTFEGLDLRQQIEIVRGAHIFIGPHGQALAHAIHLSSGSVLIELENVWRGDHYHNIAVWKDLYYIRYVHDDDSLDVLYLLHSITLALKVVAYNLQRVIGVGFKFGCKAQFTEKDPTLAVFYDCFGREFRMVDGLDIGVLTEQPFRI